MDYLANKKAWKAHRKSMADAIRNVRNSMKTEPCEVSENWAMYKTSDFALHSALVLLATLGCGTLIILMVLCFGSSEAHADMTITDKTAVLAIIGESEGESQTCKIAISEVLRRRGSLKGVYGVHAKRVLSHKYSPQVAVLARAAWFDSRFTNYSRQADGWGCAKDLVKFKQCAWFKNCEIVAHIDGTYFWKRRA